MRKPTLLLLLEPLKPEQAESWNPLRMRKRRSASSWPERASMVLSRTRTGCGPAPPSRRRQPTSAPHRWRAEPLPQRDAKSAGLGLDEQRLRDAESQGSAAHSPGGRSQFRLSAPTRLPPHLPGNGDEPLPRNRRQTYRARALSPDAELRGDLPDERQLHVERLGLASPHLRRLRGSLPSLCR